MAPSTNMDVPCTHRDCGLACALMVLHTVGFKQCDYAVLRGLCRTTRYALAQRSAEPGVGMLSPANQQHALRSPVLQC